MFKTKTNPPKRHKAHRENTLFVIPGLSSVAKIFPGGTRDPVNSILMFSLSFFSNLSLLLPAVLFIIISDSHAGTSKLKVPENAAASLNYLMDFSGPDAGLPIEMKAIIPLLDFIITPKSDPSLYRADKKAGAEAAYCEFDIKTDLKHIVSYAVHPEVSAYMMMPSSVRHSYWLEIDDDRVKLPMLCDSISELNRPVVIKGRQYVEITPDANTGGYYNYNLYKELILCRYKSTIFFITISNQNEASCVAKKGFAIGPDENWNFLYTGKKGLSKKGLGWVSSYMYYSFTVAVFYEPSPGLQPVKCGTIKWLNAGWSKINVVKSKHIYKGVERYARSLKDFFESPRLPEPDKLAEFLSVYNSMPVAIVKEKVKEYLLTAESLYKRDSRFYRRSFAKLLRNNSLLEQMSEKEMRALLKLEALKCIIGKGRPLLPCADNEIYPGP